MVNSSVANSSTVKKLEHKYSVSRSVNEQSISKDVKPWCKVMTVVLDIFFGLLVIFSGLFCFNILNNRIQGTPASLMGFSAMRVASGSMMPEFAVGDAIMVHAVKTHTLSEGDRIAFYVYNEDIEGYLTHTMAAVPESERNAEFLFDFNQLMGVQTNDVRTAALNGATLVFHEIVGIQEDETGKWWFTTKGTNNASQDNWRIEEQYIVGVYVGGPVAKIFAKLLSSASTSWAFLLALVVPVLILAYMIIRASFKDVQLAKLELDCVEEKRKITDPICVKNKVGLNLSRKDKFKVLATAPEEEKMEYVNLLWPAGKVPNSIRKYYLKRGAMLGPIQKLRDINRECEIMYRNGESLQKISTYYDRERGKIEKELQLRYKRILQMK